MRNTKKDERKNPSYNSDVIEKDLCSIFSSEQFWSSSSTYLSQFETEL